MRKVLVVVTMAAVAVGLLAWLITSAMTSRPAAQWPLGLGMVRDVPKRHPPAPANPAAEELSRLALAMNVDFRTARYSLPPEDAMRAYMLAQAARADATIEPPPPEVGEMLAKYEAPLATVREFLVRSEPLRWPVQLGVPSSRGPSTHAHLMLNRMLTASALDRARRGDAGAWDDLHATWTLSRSMLDRPEVTSVLVGFSIARILNAAARKMPLPEPAWMAEVRSYDYRRALLAAQQADAWYIREYTRASSEPPPSNARDALRQMGNVVREPYFRLSAADFLETLRLGAVEVAQARDCAFDGAAFSTKQELSLAPWNAFRGTALANYGSLWARVFRFRAELEATERALALRRGVTMPKASSCADGEWLYDETGFRFSREINEPDGVIVPLTFVSPRR